MYLGIDLKMQLSHSRHDGLHSDSQTQIQMEITFSDYSICISSHLPTLRLKVDTKSGVFALEAIDPFAKWSKIILKMSKYM